MQTTQQYIRNKKFGEYRVTEADVILFKKLVLIFNNITQHNLTSPSIPSKKHIKKIIHCKEYAEQLSELNIGDKIIVSWGL